MTAEPVEARPPARPPRRGFGRYGPRIIALGYLAVLLVAPVCFVFYKTFENGLQPVIDAVTNPEAMHALWLSLIMLAIAVPLNTIFGVIAALVIVRTKLPGRGILNVLIDIPFAVSPVVVGLSLVLIYGRNGALGDWIVDSGFQVIFSPVGMALATVFISLPFVVREVIPVLREIGDEPEQASETLGASRWQTFWRITLPGIRWGVAYGVVLTTARALGEYGAVAVVSGKLVGETETLPLHVEQRFGQFDLTSAYTASFVLAAIALTVLLLMQFLKPKSEAM
jgi:sulfate/thiosulfate transport system permease protein